MSVLAVIEIPGGSAELDYALMHAWDIATNPPPGNVLRIAGPMDGGWRVVSLWESRQHFEVFFEGRLHMSLQDTGAGQPVISIWEVETVDLLG